MKPIERLEWYLKQQKIRFGTVERQLELGTGYLSKQIKRGGSIGSDILERVFAAYPALNPSWLLTGKGEPELSGNKEVTSNVQQLSAEGTQITSYEHLKMIDNLDITDREKYQLCKMFAEKMILQVDLLEKELRDKE